MADESFGERTEAPTPRRLEEARERGQVARSSDLTAALMLLGGVGVLYLTSGRLGAALTEMLRQMLRIDQVGGLSAQSVGAEFAASAKQFGLAIGPLLAAVTVLSVVANVLQGGLVYSSHPLKPSLDKLDPVAGFGRIFSRRALARLVGSLAKLAAITWVSYAAVKADYGRIVALSDMGLREMVAGAAELVLGLSFKLAAVLIVLAALDYMYQRWQYLQDLRMTRQELREELKRMEGDPLIKEQRRHIQRRLAMHRMSAEVPTADAVITNPTHYAVAIRYDSEKMAAPQVVAKGADLLARRIREIAMEHGVPIVEKPALARALYKTVEVGREIPVEFYKAVAEVLAFVYRLTNRRLGPAAA